MVIPEFICGVAATLLVEAIAIGIAVWKEWNNGKEE